MKLWKLFDMIKNKYSLLIKSNKNTHNAETDSEQSSLPYTHCLNCGTELKGMYCHSCGQEAVSKVPTIKGFVLEYLNNAFIWDSQFLKTFWILIRRPGHLTNEFLAGKFTSQEHPLKLNMFLLFIFITLFVFFASADKMTDSMHSITNDERVYSGTMFQMLVDDAEYAKKMEESPRDTILLHAPLFLTENYSQFISNIEIKEDTGGEGLDKWVAVVPRVLVEDDIVVADDSGYYRFKKDDEVGNSLDIFNAIWAEMVNITSQYFPIILLLTVPFLTLSLRFVQMRSNLPRINHFIFALHYMAFLETLIICIYILYLMIDPSMKVLEYVLMIGSCLYMTIAFRRVYTSNTWVRALLKSLLTSIIYFVILLLVLIVIFIASCIITVINMI
jgi:hypothetical protein